MKTFDPPISPFRDEDRAPGDVLHDDTVGRPPKPLADVLATGQWLGTHNGIGRVWEVKRGWRVSDWTGWTYKQEDHPEGLLVSGEPYAEKVLRPWPLRTRSR